MDATLLGGPQTTFVGAAVREGHLYGACAGNSRAYLVGEAGVRILTEESSPRLGSGRAQPTAIHVRLAPRDVVLLMSDARPAVDGGDSALRGGQRDEAPVRPAARAARRGRRQGTRG